MTSEVSYKEPNDTKSKDSYRYINIELTPNKIVRVHCVNHYQKVEQDDDCWHESTVIHIPLQEFVLMLEKLGITADYNKVVKEIVDY